MSLITSEDFAREVSTARREVDRLLAAVRDFSVIAHDAPWLHLEDLLRDLRMAVTTVSALEGLEARSR